MTGSLLAFPVHLPRSLIVPSSFYGMGFAASALPVARQVYPERAAVGFVGDGSFQMMMHVLPMPPNIDLASPGVCSTTGRWARSAISRNSV